MKKLHELYLKLLRRKKAIHYQALKDKSSVNPKISRNLWKSIILKKCRFFIWYLIHRYINITYILQRKLITTCIFKPKQFNDLKKKLEQKNKTKTKPSSSKTYQTNKQFGKPIISHTKIRMRNLIL